MKRIMFLPFVFTLLVSCIKGETDKLENIANVDPSTVNKTVLLQLVNDVRKKGCNCGDTYYGPAPAISWNQQLETAAYNHSRDMYNGKYFSHESPDGLNAGKRITNAGYNWLAYGENIGKGYPDEQAVISGWLSSAGHCRNIMSKAFKEMGVARVGNYWTQVMASK